MKLFVTLASTILSIQSTYSQVKLPKFGEVSKEDLLMKECSFDKTAGAMILIDEAEAIFDVNFNLSTNPVFEKTKKRTRIKIFDKKEFDLANITVKYLNANDVSIRKFNAQTYNLDTGNNIVATKVDKASIYDKEISKREKQFIFTFPDVKEGCVLEFEYELDGQTETEWYFQSRIPTAYSKYKIAMEKGLDIVVLKHCNLPVEKGNDPNALENINWYIMKNIPALLNEPFMSCKEDYLQRLEIRLSGINISGVPYRSLLKTWPEIIKNLINDEDFGIQLKKEIPRTTDLDNLLIGVTDTLKKVKIIHNYVRSNMKWNGIDNIWALNGVKSAWKSKEGTSGEINLILINLLNDAGVTVKPILVSTVENGLVNITYASVNYFNKVMAYVEIGQKQYLLDATENITPSHLVPLNVMASEGLLIDKADKYSWGWKTIWNVKDKISRSVIMNAAINNKKLIGYASVLSSGYDKVNQCKLIKQGQSTLLNSFKKDNLELDSLDLLNTNNDELTLIQNLNFSALTLTTSSYTSFSLNYFIGFDKNPFFAQERKTDINFGAQQEYVLNANIELPNGAIFDELPKNIHLITPDKTIEMRRNSTFKNGILNVQISISIYNPFYTIDSYPDLKEFYKQMFDLLNEKYVYKL